MSKNIFIAGATSGFGIVVAKELVSQGYVVLIATRSQEKAKKLLNDLVPIASKSGGSIDLIECDLSSIKSIEEASKKSGF